jgi:hypothetical protein
MRARDMLKLRIGKGKEQVLPANREGDLRSEAWTPSKEQRKRNERMLKRQNTNFQLRDRSYIKSCIFANSIGSANLPLQQGVLYIPRARKFLIERD